MLDRRSPIPSLKTRALFLALRSAPSWATPAFVLAGKRTREPDAPARVGNTVTKKLGNAVVRNRIRRRLREVVRHLPEAALCAGFDYVLIARRAALQRPFETLIAELEAALSQVNAGRTRKPSRRGGAAAPKSAPRSKPAKDAGRT